MPRKLIKRNKIPKHQLGKPLPRVTLVKPPTPPIVIPASDYEVDAMWDEPNEYKMYEGLYIPREQLNEEQRTTANRADSLYRASADDFETEKYKLSPYINLLIYKAYKANPSLWKSSYDYYDGSYEKLGRAVDSVIISNPRLLDRALRKELYSIPLPLPAPRSTAPRPTVEKVVVTPARRSLGGRLTSGRYPNYLLRNKGK